MNSEKLLKMVMEQNDRIARLEKRIEDLEDSERVDEYELKEAGELEEMSREDSE